MVILCIVFWASRRNQMMMDLTAYSLLHHNMITQRSRHSIKVCACYKGEATTRACLYYFSLLYSYLTRVFIFINKITQLSSIVINWMGPMIFNELYKFVRVCVCACACACVWTTYVAKWYSYGHFSPIKLTILSDFSNAQKLTKSPK